MKHLIAATLLSTSLAANATAIVSNPVRSVSTGGILTLVEPEPLPADSDTKTTDGPFFGGATTAGLFEDMPSGNRASVAIAATQVSSISGDGVSFRGDVSANVSLNGSAITANATSLLDVDFILLQPHAFTLDLSLSAANPNGGLIPYVTVSGIADYLIFDLGNFSFSDSISGVLPAGTHHLSIQMIHESGLDARGLSPTGVFYGQSLSLDLSLEAISAPDYGSTAFLLLLPLGLMLQKRAASSRVTSSR